MRKAASLNCHLTIERLGSRGDGVARTLDGLVYVPYALAGETVIAEIDGQHGRLVELRTPSRDRIAPCCPYYGRCGGCAVQTLRPPTYAEWKRNLVVSALKTVGVQADVDPLVNAHGAGRRRATLHARVDGRHVRVGFMQARAHAIIDLDICPVLAPSMRTALSSARAIAEALSRLNKPLDILITATASGLDVDLRGCGHLSPCYRRTLCAVADTLDLARISNHGDVIALRRAPILKLGAATVQLPAGVFLQATQAAEEEMARRIEQAFTGARRVADLFCGVGTFALRLARRAEVHAVEMSASALHALGAAHRATAGLCGITTEERDLFRRPLLADELARYHALVFDPPRAGAEAQAQEIAASSVPIVAAVSCSAATFARDARILVDGGYVLESVTPLDQFLFSPHIEIVARFRRRRMRAKKRASLLG